MHFAIRDVAVFSINDYELLGRKPGINRWGYTHVESHLCDHPCEGCPGQHEPGAYGSCERSGRENIR